MAASIGLRFAQTAAACLVLQGLVSGCGESDGPSGPRDAEVTLSEAWSGEGATPADATGATASEGSTTYNRDADEGSTGEDSTNVGYDGADRFVAGSEIDGGARDTRDASIDGGMDAVACADGDIVCNGLCIDPPTDNHHCGGCTTACPIACAQGQCTKIVAITAGHSHVCGLTDVGTARCWGNDSSGQLGAGAALAMKPPYASYTPVAVSALRSATALTAGSYRTCAVLSTGGAQCWGSDALGQLGDGRPGADSAVPVTVSNVIGATALSGGSNHACALLSAGSIQCWGFNATGQLGDGTTTDSLVPVNVSMLTGASALAAGISHTCALVGGLVRCWGDNTYGQLGDGTTTQSAAPVTVIGVAGATAISSGAFHTCAVVSGGATKCWGLNSSGQLGDGTTSNSSVPLSVSGLTGAKSLAGGEFHTCALGSDGIAHCWGSNALGQLGDGTTMDWLTPVRVSTLAGATALAACANATCALIADGIVQCWGDNADGNLGNGSTMASLTPVAVAW